MLRRFLSAAAVPGAALFLSHCAMPGGAVPDDAADYRFGRGPSRAGVSTAAERDTGPAMLPCTTPSGRPGLGTEFGRRVSDKVGSTIFERDSARPLGVAKVFYNDAEGAAAMTGGDYSYATSFRDYAGGVFRMGLRNHRGGALSAYQSGRNLICLGEAGERYVVEVENLSNHRLEFVVTVDGLDVLTGQAGSYQHRGHVLNPGERREIKGWRTSYDEVAVFKFGTVRDSYVQRSTGDARNAGVIGCAAFAEKGTTPRPYAGTDVYRRLHADPFIASPHDSGFASPPKD